MSDPISDLSDGGFEKVLMKTKGGKIISPRIKPGGGHSLIKVKGGGPTLRFLPRAVQQLKMPPRADTKSHF